MMAPRLPEPLSITAAGGYCVPSVEMFPASENCEPAFPEVFVDRGVRIPKVERTIDPAPVGAGPGHWQYALRGKDGETVSCRSYYDQAPFTSREEAIEQLAWLDGVLVRRWIPDPPEWEEVPE